MLDATVTAAGSLLFLDVATGKKAAPAAGPEEIA
jgi:hypothetical protein